MENLTSKFGSFVVRNYRMVLTVLVLLGALNAVAMSQSATANSSNSVLCNLYSAYYTVQTAIFVIGILLMILGGALYAGSHVMPGQSKGTMQGYAMGMILGGVIGVVIAVIAPYIFGLIVGQSVTSQIGGSNPYAGYC